MSEQENTPPRPLMAQFRTIEEHLSGDPSSSRCAPNLFHVGYFRSGGPVAQRLEQRTHNPLVLGSNPSGPTNITKVKLVQKPGWVNIGPGHMFSFRSGLMRSLCAAACWCLLALQAQARESNKPLTEYTHTVWTHKDGIPSAFLYSIAQTRDGYLWLATTDGLVLFDGARFLHWRPNTGHTALLGVVRSLCATRDGSLWIGTAAGLVGHIRGDDLTTFSVGAQVEAIFEDRDGTLWIATENNLLRFRAATQEQMGTAITLPGTFLSGPLQDRSGSIWFTTLSGAQRLGPPLLRRRRGVPSSSPQGPPAEIAKGKFWLSEDTNGDIWLTRPDGSTRPANEGQIVTRPEMETKTLDIQTVLRDSNGNTWI